MKTSTLLTSLAPRLGREKCWYTVLCKLSNSVAMEIYCVTLTSSSQSSLSAITLHSHHTPQPSHSTAIALHSHHTPPAAITLHSRHTPQPSHSTAITLHTITLHSHHAPQPSHSTAIIIRQSPPTSFSASALLAYAVCPSCHKNSRVLRNG